MKKCLKLTLTAGAALAIAWCIPPVRVKMYGFYREFSRDYAQRERELREAVMPETTPLSPRS